MEEKKSGININIDVKDGGVLNFASDNGKITSLQNNKENMHKLYKGKVFTECAYQCLIRAQRLQEDIYQNNRSIRELELQESSDLLLHDNADKIAELKNKTAYLQYQLAGVQIDEQNYIRYSNSSYMD